MKSPKISRAASLCCRFALTLLALAPARVQAGTCAPPQPVVFPSEHSMRPQSVPTNVRVLVFFPGAEAMVFSTPQRFTATATQVRVQGLEISLREAAQRRLAGGKQDRQPVAEQTLIAGTTLPIFELRPKTPLSPNTKYQVVFRSNAREFIVQEFTTGAGIAELPVGGEEIERARYYTEYPCVATSCAPFAEIRLRGRSASPFYFYEVHRLGEDGEVREGTLQTIVFAHPSARGMQILFGGAANGCWPDPDFKFPAHGKLRLGIRPVDLAGNRGPLLRTTLDLDAPLHKLDPVP